MRLLIFAHRGEAKAFIKNGEFQKVRSFDRIELFEGSDSMLLICGEGIENALAKTSFILGRYPSINHIFNIGICGSLSEVKELNTPFEVSYLNAVNNSKFEYKSFECETKNDNGVVLMTTNQRILQKSQVEDILPLAKYVDREAWGIALAAHQFQIGKIHCLKLASDHVQVESQFCERVKEESLQFSENLLEYYLEHFSPHSKEDLQNETGREKSFPIELNQFYFTQSQKNRFLAILKKLNLSINDLFQHDKVLDLSQKDMLPKVRTKKLIQYLDNQLNPHSNAIRTKIEDLLKNINHQDISLQFDKKLESAKLKAHLSFQNENDLREIFKTLESIPFHKIQKIFNGDIDSVQEQRF